MTNFFRLEGTVAIIDQTEFIKIVPEARAIENLIYEPNELISPEAPFKWKVENKIFRNVSFRETCIQFFEFSNVDFIDCLFTGAILRDCIFEKCSFVRSNTHKIVINRVYIDPASFEHSLNPFAHQNIGVHLYQALLSNSQHELQTAFSDKSKVGFEKWKRLLYIYNRGRSSFPKNLQLSFYINVSRSYQYLLGCGSI